jgi:glycine cleavage system H protein
MSELKFTNDHECIKLEGDIAWVGITQYAQDALGDLVFIELPEIGKKVKKREYFAVVESVKTAAEVYSPVDGEVVEVNSAMPSNLDMIKEPVSGNGWIAKIKMRDTSQVEALMDEAAYKAYLAGL